MKRQRIGTKIAEIRKEKGQTQRQLAQKSGLSVRHIQMLEAGRADIRLSSLEKIAQSLDVEIQLLFGGCDRLTHSSDAYCYGHDSLKTCTLDSLPVAVQISDANGLILFVNSMCESLQGYNRADICGKMYIWDLLADEEEKPSLKSYLQFLIKEKPKPTPYVSVYRSSDGKLERVRVSWNYLLNATFTVVGFISVISRDLSILADS